MSREKRGGRPGINGQLPHQRNEAAAKQIEILAGYGLPQIQISEFIEAVFDDQGYSVDTLQRHYGRELKSGKAKAKVQLMQGAYDRAFRRNVPEGVAPDTVYREAGRSIEWLLNAVHEVVPHQNQRHSGPDGGAIPHANIDLSSLSDDDLDALERISQRLNPNRADQG